jgi:asparagine synthase (glutamine-hydrolysing)
VHRYWHADFSRKLQGSDQELLEGLDERLHDAVRQRLIADVPLGAFLSGGLDSAAVVAVMAELSSGPVKTFSIGFDDPRLDERAPARLLAQRFGTDHQELVVQPSATEMIPRLIRHYGEPFADATAIPTFYLAEMARNSVTVALNGDGGDETLGGYRRYVINRQLARLGRTPASLRNALRSTAAWVPSSGRSDSTVSRLRRSLSSISDRPAERYTRYMTDFQGFDRRAFYTPEFAEVVAESAVPGIIAGPWSSSGATDVVDVMLDVDGQTYLPDDLLFKADVATMAHSLEARAPMLDHRFVEYAAALPTRLKVNGRQTKVALRRLLAGSVPQTIVEAPKRGFQPPLSGWLRGELRDMAYDVLLDPVARGRGYFVTGRLRRLLDDHSSGRGDHGQAIWTLLMFELWHRTWVDARVAPGATL